MTNSLRKVYLLSGKGAVVIVWYM